MWNRQVKCDRYHCKLSIKQCIIRFRADNIFGCQGCVQGAERDEKFGNTLDEILVKDPNLISRVRTNLMNMIFRK